MTTPRYPADIEAAVKADILPRMLAVVAQVQAATAPLNLARKAETDARR